MLFLLLTVTPADTLIPVYCAAVVQSLLKLGAGVANGVVEDIVGADGNCGSNGSSSGCFCRQPLLQHNKWWLNQYWERECCSSSH
jgi:hypothetical protein